MCPKGAEARGLWSSDMIVGVKAALGRGRWVRSCLSGLGPTGQRRVFLVGSCNCMIPDGKMCQCCLGERQLFTYPASICGGSCLCSSHSLEDRGPILAPLEMVVIVGYRQVGKNSTRRRDRHPAGGKGRVLEVQGGLQVCHEVTMHGARKGRATLQWRTGAVAWRKGGQAEEVAW